MDSLAFLFLELSLLAMECVKFILRFKRQVKQLCYIIVIDKKIFAVYINNSTVLKKY